MPSITFNLSISPRPTSLFQHNTKDRLSSNLFDFVVLSSFERTGSVGSWLIYWFSIFDSFYDA